MNSGLWIQAPCASNEKASCPPPSRSSAAAMEKQGTGFPVRRCPGSLLCKLGSLPLSGVWLTGNGKV